MANPFRQHWTLDPEVTFLNHGSYGAVPERIQQRQQEFRREMEREPVRYMSVLRQPQTDAARNAAARFLNADPADLALIPNATHGVNTVLRSLRFAPGEELLVTDHEYNACRNALNFVAERWGAKVVVATIPFPLKSAQEVVDAVLEKVTPRTTLCLIDQITSPTALVMPMEKIIPALQAKGVRVLVDGAHAAGQIAVDLKALSPDYWTSNLHKWPCAPRGSAVLYVHPRHRDTIRPTVISHGANQDFSQRSRFHQEFDWEGTFDPTGWACIPEVLEYMEMMVPGGWPEIRRRNHALAMEARGLLHAGLGTEPVCPEDMIGSMAAIRLPADLHRQLEQRSVNMSGELISRWKIQIPVIGWAKPVDTMVRISCHLYNSREDYEKLLQALVDLRSGV